MGLDTINSQYLGLNGLASTGSYVGMYSDAYVDAAKESIANGYEVGATASAYSNASNVASSSFSQQCQTIQYLLQEGRTDDAIAKFNDLYEDMASNEYYVNYSENEIKTLLQEKYATATGTSLVADINDNASGSFGTALKNSVPIVGAFLSSSTSDDFVADVTNTSVSGGSKALSVTGTVTGAAASGALAAAAVAAKDVVTGTSSSTGQKLVAAGIAAGLSLVTSFISKISSASKTSS